MSVEGTTKWKKLMLNSLNLETNQFLYKMPSSLVQNAKVISIKNLRGLDFNRNTIPTLYTEILNEYIFNSTLIFSGDKFLNEDICGTFYKSHKFLKVIDIIDKDTNCFLDKQALNRKFNINLNYMQFLI